MAAARGAGTAYPPGAAELTPFLSGMRVVRSLVFCVLFSRSLFVIWSFFFAILLLVCLFLVILLLVRLEIHPSHLQTRSSLFKVIIS